MGSEFKHSLFALISRKLVVIEPIGAKVKPITPPQQPQVNKVAGILNGDISLTYFIIQ